MADGRPPHANIHPMRVIFMIPSKPPPKVSTSIFPPKISLKIATTETNVGSWTGKMVERFQRFSGIMSGEKSRPKAHRRWTSQSENFPRIFYRFHPNFWVFWCKQTPFLSKAKAPTVILPLIRESDEIIQRIGRAEALGLESEVKLFFVISDFFLFFFSS